MEIYRGSHLSEVVGAWAEPLQVTAITLPGSAPEMLLLAGGLGFAAAAWHAQRSWLLGLLGEWKVRRLLRRHRIEAVHDVLLPRADGRGLHSGRPSGAFPRPHPRAGDQEPRRARVRSRA